MTRAQDEALMRRAIGLARERFGLTRPNPAVGCVIARDGAVLAEAATAPGGRPHAEEAALAVLGEPAGAVAYVTLEPCGVRSSGAPSCAERLVRAGIVRVAIACEDPSPYAAGQGADRLRAAGVSVELGLLAVEAEDLYEGYRWRLLTGRPLVAAAPDGTGAEALFSPGEGESLQQALLRLGGEGFARLWVPEGSGLARDLAAQGLLHRGR